MDDERTGGGEPPLEPPRPPAPPPAPARPVTPAGWPRHTGWQRQTGWQRPPTVTPRPEPVLVGPRLDVGKIVGRTFDTFGREWSLFLVLSLPAGISGFASAVLSPPLQAVLRDPASPAATDQVASLVAQLLIALLAGASALATIVAADAFWRGRAIGLGEAVGRAVRLVPRGFALLVVSLLFAIAIGVAFIVLLLLMAAPGAAGAGLALLAMLVLFPVLAWVSARLSVLLPVLALEETPVLDVYPRTWRLTRGNALVLFLATLVIGLCGLLPSWGGALFSLFVDDRFIAGIAAGLASLVVAPLGAIWTVLAWGQLTGAPYRDSEVMATGRGRALGFALILGVGAVLLLVGGALGAAGSEEFLRLSEGI